MSIQFGKWNVEGPQPTQDCIDKVSATLAPYGPDSNESYLKGGVAILYRAFHTTKESHREKQPYVSPSGSVLTWDGRLDNGPDLNNELRGMVAIKSTDVAIVAAAYEKWGAKCLGKIIGDWALSIWNPIERSLLLAKDHIGTRHLFYSIENNRVTWSTILDPLVLFATRPFSICEEYIAGWFSYLPAANLTPYVGIHSVPPSSCVLIRPGKHIVSKYWDFDRAKRIIYRTDTEYEEHFRASFSTAVQRRLRSDRPVLAELSGGMDSSSIVCMADLMLVRGQAECPRLDTISWYDDSCDHIEPDTNELHWIRKVEQKRNRIGHHINLRLLKRDTELERPFGCDFDREHLASTPSAMATRSEHFMEYAAYRLSQGYRVTLSGIGGDEVTSGDLPTPTQELQNLLSRARLFALAHQLNAWAAKMRKPRLSLLWEAVRGFLRRDFLGACVSSHARPVAWLHPDFILRNRSALYSYPSRVRLFGPLPSFQASIVTLGILRSLLAVNALQPDALSEMRFPYLDRDLLEFLFATPREQIVGVGKRRFLMKRALVDIVPDEILNRRRKRFVHPRVGKNSEEWPSQTELGQHFISSSMKIIDAHRFIEALGKARNNEDVAFCTVGRTLTVENWLRHLLARGVLTNATSATSHPSCFGNETLRATAQPKNSAC